jgi:hypothetical protein
MFLRTCGEPDDVAHEFPVLAWHGFTVRGLHRLFTVLVVTLFTNCPIRSTTASSRHSAADSPVTRVFPSPSISHPQTLSTRTPKERRIPTSGKRDPLL